MITEVDRRMLVHLRPSVCIDLLFLIFGQDKNAQRHACFSIFSLFTCAAVGPYFLFYAVIEALHVFFCI